MTTLPTVSRAAVLRKFNQPLSVEEVPVPQVIEPGAVLVRIEACSICGTDVHMADGELSLNVNLPVIIGHEMAGRVIAVGSGVERDSVGAPLRIGDRITYTNTSCGTCYFCTTARASTLCVNRRSYGYENVEQFPHLLGGFTEYGYVLPDAGRVRVPDSVSSELASLSSCALRTVMHAMSQLGAIEPTDVVVIQGAGPLGLFTAANARVRGARKVIVIGGPASRLELAEQFGAHECILLDTTSPAERLERVHALTGGRGADIVIEVSGANAAFNEGIQLVRRGGRYLMAGILGEGKVEFQPALIVKKNITVLGSFSADARSYSLALEFMAAQQHNFAFEKMITGRYKLDDVNLALKRMKNLEETKPMILV
ncbi:MAG: alcohol dehydrogenase [Herminiimonas sp.]|nr:alcohol dehydrogenase [Herminiimonas sp.]